jgi:hypothetical protein
MELDELKDLWKRSDAVFQPKADTELASMLRGSSKSIVGKLKRSVWIELGFTLVSGIVLLIYALTLPSGALKWTSVSILAIFVAYSFYYVKKLMLLKSFKPTEGNLRVALENLTENLSGYLKFYKRSYTLLYPMYFCLALLFGAIERGFERFVTILSEPKTIAYLLGFATLFYVGSTWLVSWVLKKLYGNYLEKLKVLLKDLNS